MKASIVSRLWQRFFGRIEGIQDVSAQIARLDSAGRKDSVTATRGETR